MHGPHCERRNQNAWQASEVPRYMQANSRARPGLLWERGTEARVLGP